MLSHIYLLYLYESIFLIPFPIYIYFYFSPSFFCDFSQELIFILFGFPNASHSYPFCTHLENALVNLESPFGGVCEYVYIYIYIHPLHLCLCLFDPFLFWPNTRTLSHTGQFWARGIRGAKDPVAFNIMMIMYPAT